MSNHTARYEGHLVEAKKRLKEALDRENKVWTDADASRFVTGAARLLGLTPGELNGYLEVWSCVFDVMETEEALEIEARNQRGEGLSLPASEGEAR